MFPCRPLPGPDGTPPGRLASPAQPLVFSVFFAPPRALSTAVQLVVTKPSGGRWRFEVQLQAVDTDVDGDIEIEAAMDHTSSAPLMLYAPYGERSGAAGCACTCCCPRCCDLDFFFCCCGSGYGHCWSGTCDMRAWRTSTPSKRQTSACSSPLVL